MRPFTSLSALALGAVLAFASCKSNDIAATNNTTTIGQQCIASASEGGANGGCVGGAVCSLIYCRMQCTSDNDCMGGVCLSGPGGNGCRLDMKEGHCTTTADCTTGLVCASDSTCRNFCFPNTPCVIASDTCKDGACYGPSSSPGDGGGGQDASVGSQDGGGGRQDGAGLSSDSATCNAIPLADGGCNYCPTGGCAHGTCVSGSQDYSCQCDMGYTASGKSCLPTDSCKANSQCTPDYPCENTMPPGQACLGQYAAWPVSDTMATAPTQLPSYPNNGDGTVTDGVTRLVWQITVPPAGACNSPSDAGADAAATCTWSDAKAYCAGLTLAGRNDWRLPSKIELESLLDYSRASDPLIAAPFIPLPTPLFWTGSKTAPPSGAGYVWLVNFSSSAYGPCAGDPVSGAGYGCLQIPSVRCVSGTGIGPTTPAVHYTVHPGAIDAGAVDAAVTGDTVTDNWTGLTWERGTFNTAPTSNALPIAQSYCAALGGGFRLPTLKELLTLVDPIYGRPAIDSIVFPGDPSNYFLSATLGVPSGNCSLFSSDNGGSITFGACGSAYGYFVRCVH